MLFKFKQKPIVVDCLTSDKAAFDLAPIAPASKFRPKWWKNLKKTGRNASACPSFAHIFRTGFVVPSPCDYKVSVKKFCEEEDPIFYNIEKSLVGDGDVMVVDVFDGKQRFGFDKQSHHHPPDEVFGWNTKTHRNIKILTGWHLHCSEYVKFYMAPMIWDDHQTDDYIITSGMIDLKYNHTSNVHIWANIEKEREFAIPINRPLQHYIPLSERPVHLNVELVPEGEMYKRFPLSFQGNMLSRGYQKMVAKLEGKF